MKTIINNPNKINENEIDITTNKVRALIIDSSNKILVIKYADIFMLPGGKVDKDEEYEKALIREINEELGIDFNIKELIPFIQFENYLKDYPIVNTNTKANKLNRTNYYIIKTDKKIDNSKLKLTEREKQNDFSVIQLELNELLDIVTNHISSNPRNLPFKTELIKVLKEYANKEKSVDRVIKKSYKSASEVWLETEEDEDKMIIDLHIHTNYSDGELNPDELIKLAINNKICTMAITDHDTLEGIKKVDREDRLIVDTGIEIIDGIELSAKVPKGRMHILGYDFDINDVNLNKKMEELKDNSINSVLSIMEQIKRDYGIVFKYDDIKELVNANHNLGRPDIAKLCIKYGYASSVQDAFDKYLIEAHNKTRSTGKGIPYEECLDLILKSNGIPVLAHPKSLELSEKEFLELLKEMINIGLMGIEVYHPSHSKEEVEYYLDIANKYNLLISGGSDYHGPNVKPDIELGKEKIKKLSILDYIQDRNKQ